MLTDHSRTLNLNKDDSTDELPVQSGTGFTPALRERTGSQRHQSPQATKAPSGIFKTQQGMANHMKIIKQLLVLLLILAFVPIAHAQNREIYHMRLDMQQQTSQTSGAVDRSLTVLKKTTKPLADTPRFTEPTQEQDLVVAALDAAGREMERQVIQDPNFFRSEKFDASGHIEESEAGYKDSAELYVSLPEEAYRVVIYQPVFSAGSFMLARVASSSLDTDAMAGIMSFSAPADCPTDLPSNLEVVQVHGTSDYESRIDLVVMGDGYTAQEMELYSENVQTFVDAFLSEPPFSDYPDAFNIHQMNIISAESGVDRPDITSKPDEVDTVLDAGRTVESSWLNYDTKLARCLLADHFPDAKQRDFALLFVNSDDDRNLRANETSPAVVQTNSERGLKHVTLHELGHSLGKLDDEYREPGKLCYQGTAYPDSSFGYIATTNITTETERNAIPWAHWIDKDTPVPTIYSGSTTDSLVTPGLYEGVLGCDTGVFRPGFETKMRSPSAPFGKVNEELIVQQMFSHIPLLDPVALPDTEIVLDRNTPESETFQVSPKAFSNGQVEWYLNGFYVGAGNEFTLDSDSIAADQWFELKATTRHESEKVRKDKEKHLQDERVWHIVANECSGYPSAPKNLIRHEINKNGFTVSWDPVDTALQYELSWQKADGTIQTFETKDTSFSFSELDTGSIHEISVRAVNRCGNSELGDPIIVELPAECQGTPVAPQDFRIAHIGQDEVTFTWESVYQAEMYSLYVIREGDNRLIRREGGSILPMYADLASKYTKSINSRYANARAFVEAHSDCGVARSEHVVIPEIPTCTGTPSKPESVSLNRLSDDGVTATWNENTDVKYYDVFLFKEGVSQGGQRVFDNFVNLAGLNRGQQYSVLVRGVNACGQSNPAVALNTSELESCTARPEKPSAIFVEERGPDYMKLSWNPVEAADHYKVYWTAGSTLQQKTVKASEILIAGLESGSEQAISVVAVNECGTSPSITKSITLHQFVEHCAKPGKVDELWTTNVTATSFTANWDAVPNADQYQVLYKYNNQSDLETVSDTSFVKTGLPENSNLYFAVEGVNECGTGEGKLINFNLPTPPPTLSVDFETNWWTTGKAILTWQGADAVDVYRNATKVVSATTNNPYTYTDWFDSTRHDWKVCLPDTQVCSETRR